MSEDAAWAAGLFEGEGSVGYTQYEYYGSVQAKVKMTDLDVLERFQSVVGMGSVIPINRKNVPEHWKPQWVWRVSSYKDVKALYRMLKPWLCERRREQFEKALHSYQFRPLARRPSPIKGQMRLTR